MRLRGDRCAEESETRVRRRRVGLRFVWAVVLRPERRRFARAGRAEDAGPGPDGPRGVPGAGSGHAESGSARSEPRPCNTVVTHKIISRATSFRSNAAPRPTAAAASSTHRRSPRGPPPGTRPARGTATRCGPTARALPSVCEETSARRARRSAPRRARRRSTARRGPRRPPCPPPTGGRGPRAPPSAATRPSPRSGA